MLKTCVADKRGFPYEKNLKNMLRARSKSLEFMDRIKDSFKVVKRKVSDVSPYKRLSIDNATVTLPNLRSIEVVQTIYGAQQPRDRESQGLRVDNFTVITAQAFRDEVGVDVLVTGVEKVGSSLSPVGFYKSMVFTNYMGCVARAHGTTYAICFLNVAEFKKTRSHPDKWEPGCGGPVTEQGWGIEGGSVGPGNTNLTILIVHGTFLNQLVSVGEEQNAMYKGVRVLALTSALAKLEVGEGTLHTISINNILYTQEMNEFMTTKGDVSWSTLTSFLDKVTSMVTDPTIVSKTQFRILPVRTGQAVRPTILPVAIIGAIFMLLSEAVVLVFFLVHGKCNILDSEQSDEIKKEVRRFKIGDDADFVLRLAAEARTTAGTSFRASDAGAGVELIHGTNGNVRMGLIFDQSSSLET